MKISFQKSYFLFLWIALLICTIRASEFQYNSGGGCVFIGGNREGPPVENYGPPFPVNFKKL
jgi:hypothetical protein